MTWLRIIQPDSFFSSTLIAVSRRVWCRLITIEVAIFSAATTATTTTTIATAATSAVVTCTLLAFSRLGWRCFVVYCGRYITLRISLWLTVMITLRPLVLFLAAIIIRYVTVFGTATNSALTWTIATMATAAMITITLISLLRFVPPMGAMSTLTVTISAARTLVTMTIMAIIADIFSFRFRFG